MVGRFPNETECIKYSLEETTPVWLPTTAKVLEKNIAKEILTLSNWLRNDYKQ